MKSAQRTPAGPLCEGRVGKREAAVLEFATQAASFLYDFSVDGGAVGTYLSNIVLPIGALIVRCYTDEQTAVTGADSITLKAGSTALTAALDLTADSGIQSRALAGSAAGIKLAAASELQIAIATNAATAGKVRFHVEYLMSK